MKIKIAFTAIAVVVFLTSMKTTTPDMNEVLKAADFHRCGQIPGIVWDLVVQNVENGALKNELSLMVEASSVEERQYALITFVGPAKYKGQKLLLRDNNMWFSKIDLRRPVPISNRQRLSGSAANADVASANYYNDYTISASSESDFSGTPCWVLDLVAKNALVPYSRVKYWISKEKNYGVHAEFYGTSGKLIKEATFEYANEALFNGKKQRFISKIEIQDKINMNELTKLVISSIRFTAFDNAKFQKESLQE